MSAAGQKKGIFELPWQKLVEVPGWLDRRARLRRTPLSADRDDAGAPESVL
jgi:hypothetical protein